MDQIHSLILFCLLLLQRVTAESYPTGTYTLVEDYQAGTSNFFNNFNFFTGPDPTHGFVNYVDYNTALNEGILFNWNGASWFGVNAWSDQPSGRDSVRLQSNAAYSNVLIIADFQYVPGSNCGSWPAFWTSNINNWPNGGEIDIIEGINNQQVNHYSFHTGGTCSQAGQSQTAYVSTSNCNVAQTSNSGCSGWATSTNTYGNGMNAIGGGVYAMDWRSAGIRIWFFPHSSVPADIKAGKPTTSGWGTPMADLPNTSCNITSNFNNHQIIFDITFCGDWAGADYTSWGCPGTCQNQVANDPSAFYTSYWGVNSLKVYQSSVSK